MSTAIQVEGLSKCYPLARGRPDTTLRDALLESARQPLAGLRRALGWDETELFWALKDFDLEVSEGVILGVVGRNGAGKSTLLKLLSRITEPTSGRARLHGRVASLLEVGTGFHPELSGRENIYLNATILGMRRREIDRKFDEIVAFSGVERFLDTAVKRYSSGMYVRLAFAVAAHVDADILLVDEVLAVGDFEFQKRCIGRMSEVAKSGRTVLFVSHNTMVLRNLCTNAIMLEGGRCVAQGTVADVLTEYAKRGSAAAEASAKREHGDDREVAVVLNVSVRPLGPTADTPTVSEPFVIVIAIETAVSADISAFVHCYDAQQQLVFSSGSFFERDLNGRVLSRGRHSFECQVPGHLLNDGLYVLDVMLIRDRHEVIASELSVVTFQVIDDSGGIRGWNWRHLGIVRPQLPWRHIPERTVGTKEVSGAPSN